jgi:hypothetical protein
MDDQTSTPKTLRKRPLPQTNQMQILQNSDRISRINYRRRKNGNGPQQTIRDSRLANTQECQTDQIILRIWEFLPKIHPEILRPCTTAERPTLKRPTIRVEQNSTESIQRNEEAIHRRTSLNDARPNPTISNRMRRLEIRIRSGIDSARH